MPVLFTHEQQPDKGSIPVGQGAHWDSLPVGATGQVLTADPTNIAGVSWQAAGGGSGSGTVNAGSAGQLAGYAGPGSTVSGVTLGSNLSLSGTTLNAAGGSPGGTVNQIQINASGTFGGIGLPANLALSGGNLIPVGGLFPAVATHTARNAIPNAQRSAEMLVYTQNDQLYWSWTGTTTGTDSDWVQAGPLQVQHGGTVVSNRGALNLADGPVNSWSVADNSGSDRADVSATFTGPGFATASAGAATANFGTNSDWIVTLSHSASTAISFTGMAAGQRGRLQLVQDSTGTNLATFPATLAWAGGTAPTLTTTGGRYDMFEIYCPSVGVYEGSIVGQNYSLGGFTLVQSAANSAGAATATFGSSVAVGNLLVAYVSAVGGVSGVSATEGAFTLDANLVNGNYPIAIAHRVATTGGASFVVTAAGSSAYAIRIEEWHFTGTIAVGPTSTAASAGTSSPADPGAIAITGKSLVAMGASGQLTAFTPAAGYTIGGQIAYVSGTNVGLGTQSLTTIQAGSQDAAMVVTASSNTWNAAVVHYKAS